jgi:hypothetical protein
LTLTVDVAFLSASLCDERSIARMPSIIDADEFVGQKIWVITVGGWGWDVDGKPLLGEEIPKPFEMIVESVFKAGGENVGVLGRITASGAGLDGFYAAATVRPSDPLPLFYPRAHYNLWICPEPPQLGQRLAGWGPYPVLGSGTPEYRGFCGPLLPKRISEPCRVMEVFGAFYNHPGARVCFEQAKADILGRGVLPLASRPNDETFYTMISPEFPIEVSATPHEADTTNLDVSFALANPPEIDDVFLDFMSWMCRRWPGEIFLMSPVRVIETGSWDEQRQEIKSEIDAQRRAWFELCGGPYIKMGVSQAAVMLVNRLTKRWLSEK